MSDHYNVECYVLESQIRECYGRVVYTHKTHEKKAGLCERKLNKIKIFQFIISAVISGGLLGAFFDPTKWMIAISALLSTALTVLNAYAKNYNIEKMYQEHAQTAVKLWNVRESYLSLLTDLKMNVCDVQKAIKRRDDLQAELVKIYAAAPRTDNKSYELAQRALKDNEEMTFSDKEIDDFLPCILKRTK